MWQIITLIGDPRLWIASFTIILILYSFMPKLRERIAWSIFLVFPSVAVAYGITDCLKLVFKVPRPCVGLAYCPQSYAFPSGHSAVAFAALSVLAFYLRDKYAAMILFTFAGLCAVSRVMLNVHYVSDIVAGSAIGLVVGILIQRVYKSIS
jgi:undecaprenyl-diphosphatase